MKKPVPLRFWYIFFELCFLSTAFQGLREDFANALVSAFFGGLMLFFTIRAWRKRKGRISTSEKSVAYAHVNWAHIQSKEAIKVSSYIVVDVETTGFSNVSDRIIEVAAVKCVNDEIVDRFSTLINPGRFIPAKITRLTGIANSDVVDAPPFSQIADGLMNFIGTQPVVAHNASFDARFLANELSRAGYAFDFKYIDTLQLARKAFPELENHKLKTLIKALDLSPLDHQHRALADAEVCHTLFQRCKSELDCKKQ